MLLALWLVVLSAAPVTERSAHHDTVQEVPPLLVELGEVWVEAVNAGDLEAFVDLYADDVVRFPPDAEPVVGREAVRAMEQSWLTENELHAEAPTEGGFVAGDRAVAWGSFRIRQTVRATGETFGYGGRWMSVYRRGDDGTWRIWREIWNDLK